MPPPRPQQHDPFTDAPLRPTNSNATTLSTQPSLRPQTSGHSLRSNASTASSRQRQGRDLFAPALSRRPTSRATPRIEGADVFADEDSEEDLTTDVMRQRQMRRVRHGSPEGKLGHRGKAKGQEEETAFEFVNRRPDGGFLLGVAGFGEMSGVPPISSPRSAEELEQEEVDTHYASIARHYFAKGASLDRSGKKNEEEIENLRLPMMLRLREQVMQQLEDEKWMYESVDRFQHAMS